MDDKHDICPGCGSIKMKLSVVCRKCFYTLKRWYSILYVFDITNEMIDELRRCSNENKITA